MGPLPVSDVIEIEQLLARYAVGMTKDDIEPSSRSSPPTAPTARSATRTPSPTSRPWWRPRRRACSWSGRRRSSSTATPARGEQPLCFIDQTNHDMRIGWYTDTYRRTERRLALADPVDDVPPQERRPRLRPGARPAAPRADRLSHGGLDGARRVPDGARRAGSTSNDAELAPTYDGRGHARRADGAPREGASASPSTPAGCAGAGPSGSAASAARRCCAAYLGEALTARDLVEPGHLLDDRGAGADDDRLRPARAGGRRWCPAAARRRDVVPGLLRAGHRAATSPSLACRAVAHRRRLAGHRPEGVDEPRPVRPALRAAHPDRHARVGAPGHHRAVRRHGHARHHACGPIETMHGAPEFCEVFFDDVRRPVRPHARRRGPGLGGRHGPAALRAQHRAVAPRAPALHRRLERARRRGADRARSTRPRSAR